MIDNNKYYVIQAWMINDLGLKGIELNVYAIINGFSQDGETEYVGTRQYLCDFTGVSRATIDRTLNSLIDKGLIKKNTTIKNNITFNSYTTTQNDEGVIKMMRGCNQNDEGSKEKFIKENSNNIKDNINKENILKEMFDRFWNEYPKKIDKQGSFRAFKNIKNIENLIDKIIKDVRNKKQNVWGNIQYIPYPTTYLHQERWNDVIEGNEWVEDLKGTKPVKIETDAEIEEWYLREFGEKVKVVNGRIVEEESENISGKN